MVTNARSTPVQREAKRKKDADSREGKTVVKRIKRIPLFEKGGGLDLATSAGRKASQNKNNERVGLSLRKAQTKEEIDARNTANRERGEAQSIRDKETIARGSQPTAEDIRAGSGEELLSDQPQEEAREPLQRRDNFGEDALDTLSGAVTNPLEFVTEGRDAAVETFREQTFLKNTQDALGFAAVGVGLTVAAAGLMGALGVGSSGAPLSGTALTGIRSVEVVGSTSKVVGLAGIATNAKTVALTGGFLSKMGYPLAAVGVLGSMIGTYPFAGFIKEEALQTLGFATRTAGENGDIVGMENAVAAQEVILEPNAWSNLLAKIPVANVLNELSSFYKAARIKLDNDKITLTKLRGTEQDGREREETGDTGRD